jgi:hypothetical protein
VSAVRGYRLFVDWSDQGTLANALEDVTNYVNRSDITFGWGRQVDGMELSAPSSELAFELFNRGLAWDRYFSPDSLTSPIAGKIYPGRATRLEKTHLGTIYPLHVGELDSYAAGDDIRRTFSGTSLDAWGRPDGTQLSTPVYSGIRTGDAINIILDSIGWTGPRAIDPGATYIPFWWAEGDDPATAVDKLVNSEGPPAIAYVEAGTFVFRDRHHRILSTASRVSQATYTKVIPAGSGPGGDYKIEKGSYSYNDGAKYIANSVTISVDLRAPQEMQEVWSTEDPIAMAAGETQTIFVQPSDPVINAVSPTNGDMLVQSGSFTAAISRTSGQMIALTVTCTGSGTISRLALRAQPISVTRTVQVSASDQSSISRYGPQGWPSEMPWCNQYDAAAIAKRIVAVYADNRPRVTFSIVWTAGMLGAQADRYMTKILTARISNRVTVRNDDTALNRDFYVERLDHTIERFQIHRLTLSCMAVEPVQPTNVFTFDTAGKGFNDGLFGVDGIDTYGKMFMFDTAGQGFNDGQFAN